MTLAGRIRGCLLGGAIGDALGAPVEFLSLDEIRRQHGPVGVDDLVWHDSGRLGAITDDTQMTLFTVEGLIRSRGSDVPAAVHAAHRRWYGTQMLSEAPTSDAPQKASTGTVLIMDGWLARQAWLYARRAPGNACLSGLRWETMHTPSNPANPDSKGCGGVMRSAPFGLVPDWSPEQAFEIAAECAVQTHGHPSGYLAAGAFAAIVRHLLADSSLEDAVSGTLVLLDDRRGGDETAVALRRAVSAARDGHPSAEGLEQLGAGWVAEQALAMSVYCALAHPDDIRAALLLSVNHSGDSDSTGAITGNLMGLDHALPASWVNALEGLATMETLAADFALACAPDHQVDGAWIRRYPPA